MIERLAKIKSAKLNTKDHGVLTFWINVEYEDGGGQEVGGLCLDTYDKEKNCRVGTANGCEMILQLLKEMAVNDFSEMAGKIIMVLGEGEGVSFTPRGIRRLKIDGGKGNGFLFSSVEETKRGSYYDEMGPFDVEAYKKMKEEMKDENHD